MFLDSTRKRPATAVFAFAWLGLSGALAQDWWIAKPSNTGIPGEEIRFVEFAPDGKLWVGARWPFWQEGGIGIFDRTTEIWDVFSNWETSIPSEYVNELRFAADGSVWLATYGGLVHYDGDTWTVYNTSNSPLLHNKVTDIDLDADGHVWVNNSGVQTTAAAIFEFDGVNWTMFHVGQELPFDPPWNQLSDVIVDHNGHVWVSNDVLNGVAEYDGATWTLHGGTVGRFGALMEDLDGNIWLKAGVGGGNSFWKFDHTSFTRYGVASTPTAMAVDDDGSVYISHWGGQILRSTNAGATWSTYLSGLNIIVDIEPDPESTDVWVGTLGAVGHFTGSGALVRDYNSYNTGAPDYFIDYMSTDRDGHFWIATGEAGLSRFDGQRWRNWGNHNAGAEPYPFAGNEPMGGYYFDSNGVGWMGGNGIARWNPATGAFTGFWNWQNNPGMGVTLFPFFAEDAVGNLFAASKYGATYRFDTEIGLWVREPVNPYAAGGLPGMRADSQGKVWIAAWFDIHKWDGVSWTTIDLPYNDYLYDLGGINDFAVDIDDTLWLATEGGLVHWDGVDFTLYDGSNAPLPTNEVKSVAVRNDGLLALSASRFQSTTPFPNGVAVIDGDISNPANWSAWRYENSPIPHYQLGRVAFDGQGRLWVSAISEGAAVLLLEPPGAPSDLDGDGDVDLSDLALVLADYGCTGGGCTGDVDGDGDTDLSDLAALLANYGG